MGSISSQVKHILFIKPNDTNHKFAPWRVKHEMPYNFGALKLIMCIWKLWVSGNFNSLTLKAVHYFNISGTVLDLWDVMSSSCHSAAAWVLCFVSTVCVCFVRWHIIVFALREANRLWYACTSRSFLSVAGRKKKGMSSASSQTGHPSTSKSGTCPPKPAFHCWNVSGLRGREGAWHLFFLTFSNENRTFQISCFMPRSY